MVVVVPGVVIGTPEQEGKTEYIYAAVAATIQWTDVVVVGVRCSSFYSDPARYIHVYISQLTTLCVVS